MSLKHLRFSQTARDQLARLKRHTGIDHMNVIARWGLCVSLAETTVPPDMRIPADSNLEMSWEVFSGRHGDAIIALLKQRCAEDGIGQDDEALSSQFRLHVHRGIAYLSGDKQLRNITNLLAYAR